MAAKCVMAAWAAGVGMANYAYTEDPWWAFLLGLLAADTSFVMTNIVRMLGCWVIRLVRGGKGHSAACPVMNVSAPMARIAPEHLQVGEMVD